MIMNPCMANYHYKTCRALVVMINKLSLWSRLIAREEEAKAMDSNEVSRTIGGEGQWWFLGKRGRGLGLGILMMR